MNPDPSPTSSHLLFSSAPKTCNQLSISLLEPTFLLFSFCQPAMLLIGPLDLLPLLLVASQAATADSSQRPIDTRPAPAPASDRLPPFSIVPCPEACPCCPWCEPLGQCKPRLWNPPKYNNVRNLVGCDSLPEDTPVCPVGKCSDNCLCRETLMKQLEGYLLNTPESDPGFVDDEPEEEPELPRQLSLIPMPPPFWGWKPTCTKGCPCCPGCQPIDPNCGSYKSANASPYQQIRSAVGCSVHPATTPLCPPGNCASNCVCREVLLEELDGILFDKSRPFDTE